MDSSQSLMLEFALDSQFYFFLILLTYAKFKSFAYTFPCVIVAKDTCAVLYRVIQNADRNKKITAVVNQTNRVVTQTGKAVG